LLEHMSSSPPPEQYPQPPSPPRSVRLRHERFPWAFSLLPFLGLPPALASDVTFPAMVSASCLFHPFWANLSFFVHRRFSRHFSSFPHPCFFFHKKPSSTSLFRLAIPPLSILQPFFAPFPAMVPISTVSLLFFCLETPLVSYSFFFSFFIERSHSLPMR